jgi:dihydrofolate synthase / folylpolyglutamate synthase
MNVTAYKTRKVVKGDSLFAVLDKYLPPLEENSVVAVTSKIVGICEGRVIPMQSKKQKDELVKKEADYYLLRGENKYNFMLSINENHLVASAGIDESNSNGYYSLWPKNLQESVNAIREFLVRKHGVKRIGVVLTDSRIIPLRWGVTGFALAHSGFKALNDYQGKPDLFGRIMQVEKLNISDSLASTAVLLMGEGAEQTPLAVITDVPFIQFQERNPNQEELDALKISIEDDVYTAMLSKVPWKKGKRK